jgi:hypothetical protein
MKDYRKPPIYQFFKKIVIGISSLEFVKQMEFLDNSWLNNLKQNECLNKNTTHLWKVLDAC